jgi:CheY-like chemotaxis protein
MPSAAKVLVVDDEKVVADSLALIFANHGYEARVAYSAEWATEIVGSWQPALIILDVLLPGMNGIEFAIQLQGCPSCSRVILFSGANSTTELLNWTAARGHVFTVHAKPVHPSFLLDEASRLLASNTRTDE